MNLSLNYFNTRSDSPLFFEGGREDFLIYEITKKSGIPIPVMVQNLFDVIATQWLAMKINI